MYFLAFEIRQVLNESAVTVIVRVSLTKAGASSSKITLKSDWDKPLSAAPKISINNITYLNRILFQ
jgi:hypothetical protein